MTVSLALPQTQIDIFGR